MHVRGEPEYVDQVPRREAFEAAHSDVQITYHGPHWEAVIPDQAGETVINRFHLKALLDKLDELTAGGKPGGEGAGLPIRRDACPVGAALKAAVPARPDVASSGARALRVHPAGWYGHPTAVPGEAGSGPRHPTPKRALSRHGPNVAARDAR